MKTTIIILFLLFPFQVYAGTNEATMTETGYSTNIVISEFLPNPEGTDSGNEWIELFNSSDTGVNLRDWILDDNGEEGVIGTSAYKFTELLIQPQSYLVVLLTGDKFDLNNSSSDSVRLFWPDKKKAAEIIYQGPAKENTTWCQLNNVYQWCTPTRGEANKSLEPATEIVNESEQETIDYSKSVVKIIKILPDPQGADSGLENVTLINKGTTAVDLRDWILDDGNESDPLGTSAYYLPENMIDSGEEADILVPKGKFALNNDQDTLRLFSPDKVMRDKVSYENSKEGIPYAFLNNNWFWLTPEVLNGLVSGVTTNSSLPVTGVAPLTITLSFLLAFGILVLGTNIRSALKLKTLAGQKGTNEQTRIDRRFSRKAGW
jgi:hypothetical protein